jgi:hypothetical protein
MSRKVTREKRISAERKRVLVTGHTSDCDAHEVFIGEVPPCPCFATLSREAAKP